MNIQALGTLQFIKVDIPSNFNPFYHGAEKIAEGSRSNSEKKHYIQQRMNKILRSSNPLLLRPLPIRN